MRIIVTGGAGFIGSHVAEALCAKGHEVAVVDNLWNQGGGRREFVPPNCPFYQMDIRDEGIARVFGEFRPDMVVHHAAQHSVAISAREPEHDASVNILGLLNILRNCVRNETRKIVFASSGATYGSPDVLPITEDTPQHPLSPYAVTKLASEGYLRFFRDEHGLDFTALRYANVYGPRQDPNGEAGVISIFLGKFLRGEGVRIDWDGLQTRDYVFVEDVAQANVRALEAGSGQCYVIGTGVRTSVNQIYEALCNVTGIRAPLAYGPRRSGDTRDNEFDASRARAELGWTPVVALEEGLGKTAAFVREVTLAKSA
jgi:UDP-glucose 4-epimerase